MGEIKVIKRSDNPVDKAGGASVSLESRRHGNRPPAVPIKDADFKSLGIRLSSPIGQIESVLNEMLRRMQGQDERIAALESK